MSEHSEKYDTRIPVRNLRILFRALLKKVNSPKVTDPCAVDAFHQHPFACDVLLSCQDHIKVV